VVFSPWQGGRIYQLVAATNLASPVWTALTNTVSVNTNGDGVFTITQPNAANNFYRLSAQLAPQ
jgi:succinylarginine dihydrolase